MTHIRTTGLCACECRGRFLTYVGFEKKKNNDVLSAPCRDPRGPPAAKCYDPRGSSRT